LTLGGSSGNSATNDKYNAQIQKRIQKKMDIKRNGSQPSTKGSTDYFTGSVRIDPLFQANDPARAAGTSVTFEHGARTAWHTHPLGQILIVTAGCGLAHAGVALSKKFVRVTWFGFRLVKSIDMMPHLPQP
jgi:hypothetical protein